MSRTSILRVDPGKSVEVVQELHNAWRSAPLIWYVMSKRYIRGDDFFMRNLDKLWPLWKNLSIPAHHRAVLMMTYDRMYILKKDFQRAASDIEAFINDIGREHDAFGDECFALSVVRRGEVGETFGHWLAIRLLLASDPDYPAIGFWHTSVSDNPFYGPWNEETEEYDPPDWKECYDMYAELDKVAAAGVGA